MTETGLMTIRQLAEHNARTGQWPHTEKAIRWQVFNAEQTGFACCVRRVGRRVLIDPAKMRDWIEQQNRSGVAA